MRAAIHWIGNSDSERMHGLPFAWLVDKGVAHERVAKRALDVFARPNVRVFSDGIEF